MTAGGPSVGGIIYEHESYPRDLARLCRDVGIDAAVPRGGIVFVKPNYTLPFPKPGVTTHPEVLEPLLAHLKSRASRVLVGEADGGYASFTAQDSLRGHDLEGICRRTGAEMVNLSRAERIVVRDRVGRSTYAVPLPKIITQVDRSVSVPVLKTHVVVRASLGLKNLWGCHPDTLRLLDHDHLAEKLVLIARAIRLGPVVVDGLVGLDRRGPIEGDPVPVGVVLAGDNPVATDAFASRFMGFDPAEIPHLSKAHRFGLGPLELVPERIVGDVSSRRQHFHVRPTIVDRLGATTFRSRLLTKLVFDSWASGAIYRLMGRTRKKQIRRPGDEVGARRPPA